MELDDQGTEKIIKTILDDFSHESFKSEQLAFEKIYRTLNHLRFFSS